ncbi:hypothetical protein ACLIJR_14420 [Hydrogenophaga sp. XSHU_21]
MSRWKPDPGTRNDHLCVGLDTECVAWRRSSNKAVEAQGIQDGIVSAIDVGPPVRTVDVVVGLRLSVHWLVQPSPEVESFAELRRFAEVQCAQRHGGQPDDWWVTGEWHPTRAFVCVGLPRPALHGLQVAAGAQCVSGTRWRWHTPWSLVQQGASSQRRTDPRWVTLRSPTRLLMWRLQSGQVKHLVSLPMSPSDDRACEESLAAHHARRWHVMQGQTSISPLVSLGQEHWSDRLSSEAEFSLHLHPCSVPEPPDESAS